MSEDDLSTEDTDDTGGLHLWAKLALSLDTLNDSLKRQYDREQARLAALPINYPFQRLSAPAGATDIQTFGGPQPGRVWTIRVLSAFADPVAANAATVSWYVGQIMPGAAAGQLPLSMKRWEFTSLPGEKDFGRGVILVRNQETLVAGLTAVPGSSKIFLNVVVEDEPAWAARFTVTDVV